MFLPLIRLLLGPILLMQGKAVRRDILRMPEPDGARVFTSGRGPALSLLILGDSSGAGVGAATQDLALSGQLRDELAPTFTLSCKVVATTGWTTADAAEALVALEMESFDVAVLALGVNDVTTENGLDPWLAIYQRIVQRLRSRHGVKLALATGLPPIHRFPALPQPLRWYLGQQGKRLDKALALWAQSAEGIVHRPVDYEMTEADIAEDGFHPGPAIYRAWAEDVANVIRQHHAAGTLSKRATLG